MEPLTRKHWEHPNMYKRLDLTEFGNYLWKVGITTDEEHLAIFQTLTLDNLTVSLGELSAALTGCGAPIILEDVREKLLTKYGSLNDAYKVIDVNGDEDLDEKEWVGFAVKNIKLTPEDARKSFRLIDIDGGGGINRLELLGALRLVEPG